MDIRGLWRTSISFSATFTFILMSPKMDMNESINLKYLLLKWLNIRLTFQASQVHCLFPSKKRRTFTLCQGLHQNRKNFSLHAFFFFLIISWGNYYCIIIIVSHYHLQSSSLLILIGRQSYVLVRNIYNKILKCKILIYCVLKSTKTVTFVYTLFFFLLK